MTRRVAVLALVVFVVGVAVLTAALIVGVAATPFSVSPTLNAIHVTFGAALFVTQFLVGALLARRSPVLLAVAVGDLLALGALVLDWPTMWVGQVLSELGFLVVLAASVPQNVPRAR